MMEAEKYYCVIAFWFAVAACGIVKYEDTGWVALFALIATGFAFR